MNPSSDAPSNPDSLGPVAAEGGGGIAWTALVFFVLLFFAGLQARSIALGALSLGWLAAAVAGAMGPFSRARSERNTAAIALLCASVLTAVAVFVVAASLWRLAHGHQPRAAWMALAAAVALAVDLLARARPRSDRVARRLANLGAPSTRRTIADVIVLAAAAISAASASGWADDLAALAIAGMYGVASAHAVVRGSHALRAVQPQHD